MPIDDRHMSSVGHIIGSVLDEKGNVVRRPIGTGFIVTIGGREGIPHTFGEKSRHCYLVTATHVIWMQEEQVSFRHRLIVRTGGGIYMVKLTEEPVPRWDFHDEVDLAVAEIELEGTTPSRMPSMDRDAADVWHPDLIDWGAQVYYLGLFEPSAFMAEKSIPMVRSGTVAAKYVDVQHKSEDNPFQAHLIDCRSYQGFSGSPIYVQLAYPGPRAKGTSLPTMWPNEWSLVQQLGQLHYATGLFGMLIQHYDDVEEERVSRTGIGIALPVERLRELLMREDMVNARNDKDAKSADDAPRRAKAEPVDLSAARKKPSPREDFLRHLSRVTRPKNPRDESA